MKFILITCNNWQVRNCTHRGKILQTCQFSMRSLGRAMIVRAYALLTKSPFRAYALLTKSPFRAYALLTKSPFRACSVSALFGMPEWLWHNDTCSDCVQERTYFVYHAESAHLFICHSFITKIFAETLRVFLVPYIILQYLGQSVSMSLSLSILCLYLCSTDLRSLYLSLPTNQHLTPTTPKNFLFYYFIKFPEDK